MAPRRVYDRNKTRVLATIAGFGNASKGIRTTSRSGLNGRTVETKPVEVPRKRPRHGGVSLARRALRPQQGRSEDRFARDTLPADDSFYFSVERADPRHALFVHDADNTRGLLYFKTALEASGQSAFAIDPATVEQTANLNPAEVRLRGAFRCRLAARRI